MTPASLSAGMLSVNRSDECPPCFDCHLKAFPCLNSGQCSDVNGRCDKCPDGFGGDDCGIPLKRNYLQCQVTNKAIMDQLQGKIPEITYSCDAQDKTCNFQFWADAVESFFCEMSECEATMTHDDANSNNTKITCAKMKCGCYPGRMLCDPQGFDLSEWFSSDDPEEGGPRGPSDFICLEKQTPNDQLTERECRFSEPHMNQLISQVFGDEYIRLSCALAGECLHRSQLPDYAPPTAGKGFSTLIIVLMSLGAVFLLLAVFGGIMWARGQSGFNLGYENLSDDQESEVEHVPVSVGFRNVSYLIERPRRGRFWPFTLTKAHPPALTDENDTMLVLDSVSGFVQPGEILAIMGGSGAGKTTLLDILAGREKRGFVTGDILCNGEILAPEQYARVVGYVDQEDTLMSTLTVYEAIYFSAMLRLPRNMSKEAKNARILDAMVELDILHLANRRIGEVGDRGISGGEKRRVSIACELVTGKSVLYLDEPTSGLDAYNALNVMQALRTLASKYHRTIICTIHQPRSNIFCLFDRLIVLGRGKCVYSGGAAECRRWFEEIGVKCPSGFNVADWVVDLTMEVNNSSSVGGTFPANGTLDSIVEDADANGDIHNESFIAISPVQEDGDDDFRRDEGSDESDLANGAAAPKLNRKKTREELKPLLPIIPIHYATPPPDGSARSSPRSPNRIINGDSSPSTVDPRSRLGSLASIRRGIAVQEQVEALSTKWREGRVAHQILSEIEDAAHHATGHTVAVLTSSNNTYASFLTQLRLLSLRTLKNLYRNPSLLRTHYTMSLLIAVGLGLSFYHVDNSLGGFQNRMGVLFFVCCVFGFSALSSMWGVAGTGERIVFTRERAGGYYTPSAYYLSKVLFDLLPLRLVPPLMLALISYPLIGLRPTLGHFIRFLVPLTLFNVTASSACLTLSILVADAATSTLLGTLLLLFEMLFSGLLLNRNSSIITELLCSVSFFNAGWEAMMVNEVKGLMLLEKRFGLSIEVPGSLVLMTFGITGSYEGDLVRLSGMLCFCLLVGWIGLLWVRERR
ncbi:ATP-binding cassette sub- G member 2 [Gaertneriomyces sp. JEL0708]|nr:ATP-binding cassette sub- G member 2 [Gaertneriomyces sp. JEL0708]